MEEAGKVGLFGAAGAAGRIIAAALSAAGRDYRVVGRSREPLEAAFGHDPTTSRRFARRPPVCRP
jgi:nucleoside-diphosphate-sugar epimerase